MKSSFRSVITKFVVSCCAFCKLRKDFGFVCSVNHLISEGGVNANRNVTCSPSLVENDSTLLTIGKEIAMVSTEEEADVALFLQVTRMRKIIKICEALLHETRRSQSNEPWNTKQTKRIEITNHESQTMTFWTRASKHVFPKRSAKMIDGTDMQNAQRDTTNFAIKGP